MEKKGFSLVKGLRTNTENHAHTFSVGEIDGNTNWHDALKDCESVIHLAARAHFLRDKQSKKSTDLRTVNTEGTINLARQSVKLGVRRFIFISSIGVNGAESFQKPFTEMDIPSPHSPYAVSKYEAELGLLKLAKQTNIEIVIIRPPLVYGPGAPGIFSSLIRWLDLGIPLPLGATNNCRSLVALKNLVDLIITCLNHPAATNQTFMVSDDEDISTTELLFRTSKALGKPAYLLPVPKLLLQIGAKLLGKQEIITRLFGNLQVDISHTKQILGWTPPINVDDGLKKTAEWYLSQR